MVSVARTVVPAARERKAPVPLPVPIVVAPVMIPLPTSVPAVTLTGALPVPDPLRLGTERASRGMLIRGKSPNSECQSIQHELLSTVLFYNVAVRVAHNKASIRTPKASKR